MLQLTLIRIITKPGSFKLIFISHFSQTHYYYLNYCKLSINIAAKVKTKLILKDARKLRTVHDDISKTKNIY